jgi:hypothetical protein
VCLQQAEQLCVLDARHLEHLSRPVADVARLQAVGVKGGGGRKGGGWREGEGATGQGQSVQSL